MTHLAPATDTLQATHDLRKVALWLGHASIQTTEIYVRADPHEKLAAIEAIVPPALRRGRFKAPDQLLAMLGTKVLPAPAVMRRVSQGSARGKPSAAPNGRAERVSYGARTAPVRRRAAGRTPGP